MSMVSRWPVRVTVEIEQGEIDASGMLTDAAIERVFAEARDAYLGECASLRGVTLVVDRCTVRQGEATVPDGAVSVVTGVVEVFPDAFTMTARVRPRGGQNIAATAECTLRANGELPIECRDEFIARAHSAEYTG